MYHSVDVCCCCSYFVYLRSEYICICIFPKLWALKMYVFTYWRISLWRCLYLCSKISIIYYECDAMPPPPPHTHTHTPIPCIRRTSTMCCNEHLLHWPHPLLGPTSTLPWVEVKHLGRKEAVWLVRHTRRPENQMLWPHQQGPHLIAHYRVSGMGL